MNLRLALRVGGGLPFDAGREACAAAAAQAGLRDRSMVAAGPIARALLQAGQAAMGTIVVQRQRIDDAAAGEGQPGLPREEGDLLRRSETQALCGRRSAGRPQQARECRRPSTGP